MSHYVKIYDFLLTSSIWSQATKDAKILWITMLAMKNRDHRVLCSLPGLSDMARLTMPETEAALELLMKPDPYSRTKAKDGRRVEPIEGGWLVVNGEKYDRLFKEQRDAELNRARVNRFRQPNGDDGGAPHNENGTVSAPPEESQSNARGTLAELVEFVVSLGLPASDGEHLFHRWEGNGWTNSKQPIRSWRATARSWKAHGYMPSQKAAAALAPRQTNTDIQYAPKGTIQLPGGPPTVF